MRGGARLDPGTAFRDVPAGKRVDPPEYQPPCRVRCVVGCEAFLITSAWVAPLRLRFSDFEYPLAASGDNPTLYTPAAPRIAAISTMPVRECVG